MKNIIISALVSLTLVATGIVIYHNMSLKKMAFVDSRVLFEEFEMKKELENNYKTIENKRRAILDSMELVLKMKKQNLEESNTKRGKEAEHFNSDMQEYMNTKAEFEELNLALTNQYNDQIWKRVNVYLKEYGKENNYDYIFGLTGDPIILFSGESEDITQNVIKFINTKYEGK